MLCLVMNIYLHLQGSSSTAITPELETIFSPNFEDGDSQLNSINHGYEGTKLPFFDWLAHDTLIKTWT